MARIRDYSLASSRTGLKQGNPFLYLDLHKIIRKAFDDADKFTTVYSFDQF